MQDLDGQKPEIYISTSNRSAGKTTFFNGYAVHDFLERDNKFCLLYRNKYEMEHAADTFFGEIGKLFFKGLILKQETLIKNVAYRLLIGENYDPDDKEASFCGICCGYVTSLSSSEQIKRASHLLSDTTKIIFDEFQSEKGTYLKNEIALLMSIHDSIARGNGEQARYLPLYLIGNLIDIYNPYYEALGITQRIDPRCNYMRGNGWVLEQGFNASASAAHQASAFHRAFSHENYVNVSLEKQYLITDSQFICNNIPNYGLYIGTITHNKQKYGIRYIDSIGTYYISKKIDPSALAIFAATENDIDTAARFFQRHNVKTRLKEMLHRGQVLFDSRQSKKAGLAFIYGYD